jgi:cytochrome c-type biogenesis protein CcmF
VASTAVVLFATPFVQETVRPGTSAVVGAPVEAGLLPAPVADFFSTHGTSLMLLFLLFSAFFALYGNSAVFWRVARGNPKLAGGSMAHVGFALVLLGIFGSSVFNDPVTDGAGADLGAGNRDNFIAPLGTPVEVDGYTVTYNGIATNEEGRSVYVMDWTSPGGTPFQTRNVVYKDGRDQWIQHPVVREGLFRDLYVAAFPRAMDNGDPRELLMRRGESSGLRDASGRARFQLSFVNYDLAVRPESGGLSPDSVDLAVGATLEVRDLTSGETRTVTPIYALGTDRRPLLRMMPIPEWGLGIAFVEMDTANDAARFVIEGAQADWVVVQAYEKPFISVLWLGTLILVAGVVIALRRRALET